MININNIKKSLFLFATVALISCGGSDDTPPPPEPSPDPAILIAPLKDAECNEGNIISDDESRVDFEWNKALNATKYTLVIKNLNTNQSSESNTNNTKTTVTLLRGVPYSWKVISLAGSSGKSATSETWNFYNAGKPLETYAPFPAYDPKPAMGTLTSNPVTLEWKGGDIDKDIVSYDVYLGTETPPTTLQANTTSTKIQDIQLVGNTLYYWQVITKDSEGNNSKSQIFEFRTQ